MASKIEINLDTSKELFLNSKCKQNDDLTLECYIFENGLAKDLSNCSIVIQALKADRTYIIQNTDITKDNNKFTANLVRDFTRVAGKTEIEIVLTESSKQNTTFSFCLEVIGSVIKGAVQSSNTVTILEDLQGKIEEAGQVRDETEQLIQSGGAATKGDIREVTASLEQKTDKSDLDFHVVNLNADNGLCVICKLDNKVLMYDFGMKTTSNEIIDYCNSQGITKIDYAILSHWHSDHYGGVENLLDSSLDFSQCTWYLPPTVDYSRITEDTTEILIDKTRIEMVLDYQIPNEDEILTINEKCKITFLNCKFTDDDYAQISETGFKNGTNANSLNAFSTVCLLEYNSNKILLLSDIEKFTQDKIASSLSQVDIMLSPHHFFNKSCSGEFYRKLSPKICVSSTNIGSSGLPKVPDYYFLKDIGTEIYTTVQLNQDCKFELRNGIFKAIGCKTIDYRKSSGFSILGNNIYSLINSRYDITQITINQLFSEMRVGNYFVGNLSDCTAIVNEIKTLSNGNFYTTGGENVFIFNKVSDTKMLIDVITENMQSNIKGYCNGSTTVLQTNVSCLRLATNISFVDAFNLMNVGQRATFAITQPTSLPITGGSESINYAGVEMTKISSSVAIINIVGYSTLYEYKGYYNSNNSTQLLFKKIF